MKAFQETYPVAGACHETFASRVDALRHRFGMTVQEFAEKVGGKVTRKGALDLRDLRCDQLARACGVNPVWVYAGSVAPRRFWPDWWTPPDAQQALGRFDGTGK